jgi:hypothetical protein
VPYESSTMVEIKREYRRQEGAIESGTPGDD